MMNKILTNLILEVTSESTNDSNITFDSILNSIIVWLKSYGLKLLIALIALFIYFKIVNLIARAFKKRMQKKKKVDETIAIAAHKTITIILKIIGVLLFLGYVGIDTAGVGALVGSLGIVFGLAIQGSLSNLAGGIVILVMRPFKLGDFIETEEYSGTVSEIHSFYTYLDTTDNKVVMIPNGTLANGSMINYSKKKLRRVDIAFPLKFDEDLDKVIEVIKKVVDQHPLVLKNPETSIRANSISQSSIEVVCKAWVKNPNYWNVKYDLIEQIKKEFDKNQILMAYNQMDIHLNQK